MLASGGWIHQHLLGSATASFISPNVGSMMAMMRKPVRSQAASDALGAARRAGAHGLAMSQRDLAASRQCLDIPTETLSLNQDFVVINKVSNSPTTL